MSDLVRQAVVGRRPSAAGWVRANCPHCEERAGKADHDRSLSWKQESGWWGCWRCGARGWLEQDDVPLSGNEKPALERWDASEFYSLADASRALEPARRYLRGRQVQRSVWQAADLHVALRGRYAERVIIPLRSPLPSAPGAWYWTGFAARAYGRRDPKVLYPRGMVRDAPLHAPGELLRVTSDPLMVVEGPFDALRHWPNAAAVLGQPTDAHVEVFAGVAQHRPVVVCLDGDTARYQASFWAESWAFAERVAMRAGRTVGWVKLEGRVDPGDSPDLYDRVLRGDGVNWT